MPVPFVLEVLAFGGYFGVYYWCLATRLQHRSIGLAAIFVAGTALGFAIANLVIPDNLGLAVIMSLTSGMSNVVGIQMTVARMPLR